MNNPIVWIALLILIAAIFGGPIAEVVINFVQVFLCCGGW